MRNATRLALVLLAGLALRVPILAQTKPEFIIPEFLAPQYTAPEDAPSRVVIAGKDEPGERLVVTGACKGRPDCILTQPVTRDAQGVSHVTRDIQMVKE